ncbi:hypothetical protein CF319_g6411 [Tilletia indica]|nr:hypothetical protein CF319_g6411 [Tilletia indica]
MGQLGRQQKDNTVRQEGTTTARRSKTTVGDTAAAIWLMRREGGRLGRADGTGGLKDGPGWCASSPYRAGVITIGSTGTHPGMRPTSLAPTRPIPGRHVAFFEADKLEFSGDRIKKDSKTAKGKGKGVATGTTVAPVAVSRGPPPGPSAGASPLQPSAGASRRKLASVWWTMIDEGTLSAEISQG